MMVGDLVRFGRVWKGSVVSDKILQSLCSQLVAVHKTGAFKQYHLYDE